MRLRGVADGKCVNIHILVLKGDGVTQEGRQARSWKTWCKLVGVQAREIPHVELRSESEAARPKLLSLNCQEKLLSIFSANRTGNRHRWVG